MSLLLFFSSGGGGNVPAVFIADTFAGNKKSLKGKRKKSHREEIRETLLSAFNITEEAAKMRAALLPATVDDKTRERAKKRARNDEESLLLMI